MNEQLSLKKHWTLKHVRLFTQHGNFPSVQSKTLIKLGKYGNNASLPVFEYLVEFQLCQEWFVVHVQVVGGAIKNQRPRRDQNKQANRMGLQPTFLLLLSRLI